MFAPAQCRVRGQSFFSRRAAHTSLSSSHGPSIACPAGTVHSLGTSCPSPGPVVSGTPKPEVTWFLEGAPVRRREGIIEVYEEGGCHYLCLLRARARDSGNYSCTASNVQGQVSCGWTLLVKRECAPPVTLGFPWGAVHGVLPAPQECRPRLPLCRVYNSTEVSSPPTCQGQSHCPRTVTPDQEFTPESSQNKHAHTPCPALLRAPFSGPLSCPRSAMTHSCNRREPNVH